MSMRFATDDDQTECDRFTKELHIERPVLTQQKLNDWIGQPQSVDPPTFRAQLHNACVHTARYLAPDCLKPNKQRDCLREEKLVPDKAPKTYRARCLRASRQSAVWLISFLPFIGILRKYDVKSWFLNDLIAGLTVGIMHVPQGMAYAMLATLPPVYGLYTSFFPPLVYFFFGTSRHISLGTIAVVSLLTGEFLDKVVQEEMSRNALFRHPNFNHSLESTTLTQNETGNPSTAIRVAYAPSLALTVGLAQILMGVLRIGGVIRYLSGPMTSGFTVGVAVHVFTSQMTTLLGVSIAKPVGLFAIPLTYYEIFRAISRSNLITIGLSAVCIFILIVFKTWISPPVVKRIKVPIPIDLVIVVLSTITSHYIKLNTNYHVKVVGHVSKGIQKPVLPRLDHMQDAVGDIIVLTIVAFSVNISLTRIFAKTFDYNVDCNQELYAYGLSNVIGSFFQAYPSAASLSRSAVQVSAGGKTQVATLFSSILLILVLYFIGPLFYAVPNCCLSAIIVVALKGMFLQALELKHLWKYSIWDFSIWLFTCICTVVLDVKFGLLSGIVFSAVTVILRTQSPPVRVLGQIDGTELYRDVRSGGTKCSQSSVIKVVRYEGSIYYACAEQFRQTVYRHVGLDPSYVFSRMQKLRGRLLRVEKALGLDGATGIGNSGAGLTTTIAMGNAPPEDDVDKKLSTEGVQLKLTTTNGKANRGAMDQLKPGADRVEDGVTFSSWPVRVPEAVNDNSTAVLERRYKKWTTKLKQTEDKCALQFVILDCSCWTFVDFVGAEELNQVFAEFRRISVSVLLTQCTDHIARGLWRNNKLPSDVEIFPTIHDAVLWSVDRIESQTAHLQRVYDILDSFTKAKAASETPVKDNPDSEDDDEDDEIDDHFGTIGSNIVPLSTPGLPIQASIENEQNK